MDKAYIYILTYASLALNTSKDIIEKLIYEMGIRAYSKVNHIKDY